jgi:hypothetical protein
MPLLTNRTRHLPHAAALAVLALFPTACAKRVAVPAPNGNKDAPRGASGSSEHNARGEESTSIAADDSSPRSTPGGAAPSASTPNAPVADAPCDLSRGFHGTVAGKDVFMRLVNTGGKLAGRYFYAHVGVDIALRGTVDAGALKLEEGDPKKPSGVFEGTCIGRALDGKWRGGGREFSFHLEGVEPRWPPLVATKRFTRSKRAKDPGPLDIAVSKYEQTTFELFGLADVSLEYRLSEQGPTELKPRIVSADALADVLNAEEGIEASFSRRVRFPFEGFAFIEQGGHVQNTLAAHPANGLDRSEKLVDVTTGNPIVPEQQVFSRFPQALFDECYEKWLVENTRADEEAREFFRPYFEEPSIRLRPEGVQFWSGGYPHFAGMFNGEGPTVTWSALVGAGVLKKDSPARRIWENTPPRKPGEPKCKNGFGE